MSKKSKIKILVVFFILLMIILIFVKIKSDKKTENSAELKLATVFENIDSSNTAKISKYFIYGTHMNLEGNIEIPKISKISIYSVHIVIKDIDNNEEIIETPYNYKDGKLSFSTINNINKGISLEKLTKKNYYIFLKIIFSNNEIKYYTLNNDTKYGDLTYYTLTKNNSNNKIEIKFENYANTPFLGVSVVPVDSLPENVYDIAIDASHGGKDLGVKTKKYNEADLVLKYAKSIKKELENKRL